MIDTLADLTKVMCYFTIIVGLTAIIIGIIEASISTSKERRMKAQIQEEQNEMIRKTLEEEMPKAVGEAVKQMILDSIHNNKD